MSSSSDQNKQKFPQIFKSKLTVDLLVPTTSFDKTDEIMCDLYKILETFVSFKKFQSSARLLQSFLFFILI